MVYGQKVHLHTFGCKLNFSETSSIARMFEDAGYAKVAFEETPDVYVINTCSVTENADKRCKQLVKKARRTNPEATIAIIGCYAQLKPEDIIQFEGVDMVLGAADKFKILDHLSNKQNFPQVYNTKIKHVKDFIPSYSIGDRTRSFLKIQDGCDYFCSFCTIPLARGKSRNADIASTIKQAKEIAKTNVKEIVLTGVNIGDFGQGIEGKENFYQLIQQLDNIDGIDRFRISSIEPNLLSEEIIRFVSNSKKFVPHFHIPLQSGSDVILEKMRRKYNTSLYSERIGLIKTMMPHASIGVDVIVGFPGETNEEFLKTFHFLNELDISYLHVFTYSERKQTTAVKFDGVIPKNIRAERSAQLRSLSEKKKRAFYTQFEGKNFPVLVEHEKHETVLHGFTNNYVKVKIPFSTELPNTIQEVKIGKIDVDGIAVAEVVN